VVSRQPGPYRGHCVRLATGVTGVAKYEARHARACPSGSPPPQPGNQPILRRRSHVNGPRNPEWANPDGSTASAPNRSIAPGPAAVNADAVCPGDARSPMDADVTITVPLALIQSLRGLAAF